MNATSGQPGGGLGMSQRQRDTHKFCQKDTLVPKASMSPLGRLILSHWRTNSITWVPYRGDREVTAGRGFGITTFDAPAYSALFRSR